jgi:hypothetical protein
LQTVEKSSWPPRYYSEIQGLFAAMQRAHLFVVLISEGARHSEVVDMRRDCVVYARNGMPYANGRTFKLVERLDGEEREWVLPDVAAQAIEQQARLVALVEKLESMMPTSHENPPLDGQPESMHLWAQLGSGGQGDVSQPLNDLRNSLRLFAKTLLMDEKPGGINIHAHRFRKTLARLCGLALTHSPKILQDVFGHKSIEMTLYYIMTDKSFSDEVIKVTRELRVMRAKELVEDIVAAEDAQSQGLCNLPLGGYGGPAALTMHQAIHAHKIQVHRRGEEWGADSALELAHILTMNGENWSYPRPGVICTKSIGETGACSKSRGYPEPSNCHQDCNHRLEEPIARRDVDLVLDALVRDYQASGEQGDLMTQAYLGDQIRQEVVRFQDLQAKWMQNPVVAAVMTEVQE